MIYSFTDLLNIFGFYCCIIKQGIYFGSKSHNVNARLSVIFEQARNCSSFFEVAMGWEGACIMQTESESSALVKFVWSCFDPVICWCSCIKASAAEEIEKNSWSARKTEWGWLNLIRRASEGPLVLLERFCVKRVFELSNKRLSGKGGRADTEKAVGNKKTCLRTAQGLLRDCLGSA